MHPARHVALGNGFGGELLSSHQNRAAYGNPCSQLGDMTAQKSNEVLHIGSALGQRRIRTQHERYRLRRGHQVIAL